jgi:hypothetical protein
VGLAPRLLSANILDHDLHRLHHGFVRFEDRWLSFAELQVDIWPEQLSCCLEPVSNSTTPAEMLQIDTIATGFGSSRLPFVTFQYPFSRSLRTINAEVLNELRRGLEEPRSNVAATGACIRGARKQRVTQSAADRIVAVGDFVERVYLPWTEEHKRPSTAKGYRDIWEDHLRPLCALVWQVPMRKDRMRPAFACLKIVIRETAKILESSLAVRA